MSKNIRRIRRKEKEIPITGEMTRGTSLVSIKSDVFRYFPAGTKIEILRWPDGKSSSIQAFVKELDEGLEFYLNLDCLKFDPRVVRNMKTKEFYLWYSVIMPSNAVLPVNEPIRIIDIVDPYTILVAKLNETKIYTVSIQTINFNKTYPLKKLGWFI